MQEDVMSKITVVMSGDDSKIPMKPCWTSERNLT